MEKNKRVRKTKDSYTSWKTLLKFYTKVRIPWLMLIVVFMLSFGVKEVESRLVPYNTAIQTGAIEKGGFLVGFILMTITYGMVEAL